MSKTKTAESTKTIMTEIVLPNDTNTLGKRERKRRYGGKGYKNNS